MEIIIKNGATIIKTGDANGGTKNKHNKTGVSQFIAHDGTVKYRAEIQINRKKYYLGLRDTPEEAAALRSEANEHIINNTFHTWMEQVKKGFVRNKHNKKGVSQRNTPSGKIKYQAVIHINKKKYHLGTTNTVEEAIALRTEAETQLENGTFFEWIENKK